MGNLVYNILTTGFSFILSVFYGKIDVIGAENIPKKGPVVFCGTHGNGLIDPVLIMCIGGRKISPIAKSTLFTIPVLGSLLKALDGVPVKRRQDFKNAVQDNSGALDAMAHILERGDCLVIFPEGVSHDLPEVHDLKTGFARAAVQAVMEKGGDYTVTVVPVGLNFMSKDRFRSDIFVEFGKPFLVSKELVFGDADQNDEEVSHKFVRDLTTKVKQQLESLFLVAPSWETLRVLFLARNLYLDQTRGGDELSDEELVEITHRFVNGYQKAKQENEVTKLFADMETYQSQLDLLRITDHMVAEASLSTTQLMFHVFKTVGFYLFTLPASLPGAIIHAPLGLLCKFVAKKLTKNGVDRDQVAHFKIMSAMVFVPIFYTIMGVAIWRTIGLAFVLPSLAVTFLSGYMAIQTRPLNFTFKALGLVVKFLFTDLSFLKKVRKNLRVRVTEVINKYREKYDAK